MTCRDWSRQVYIGAQSGLYLLWMYIGDTMYGIFSSETFHSILILYPRCSTICQSLASRTVCDALVPTLTTMSSSSVQGQSELLPDLESMHLIFLACGWLNREDGRIIFHDARVDRRLSNAQGVLQHTTEFTGVQAHPVMEHIFATSDSHGQVCLRDTRMAFGPLSVRSNEGIVQNVRFSFTVHGFLALTSFSGLV